MKAKKSNGHQNNNHGSHNHSGHENMIDDFKKRFFVSLIITLPIIVLSPMIQHWLGFTEALSFSGDLYLLFGLSTFVYFYGGWPFLKGFYTEMKSFKPGMMTLIAVAISVAYFYSSIVVFGLKGDIFFWELATLIDVMLLGHWIEMRSVMGASKALEELAKLMPSDAHKLNADGSIVEIPLSELKINDRVIVKPGEKFPADGIILLGETSVDESMLTGESKPVSKLKDSEVIGGSINGEGAVTVEVKKTGKDSFLSQVIDLVKEAQESKSKTQDLANRAALWLTLVALISGAITFFVWTLLTDQSLAFALERTVTVMVITCPHALGLAIPLVVAVSTALAATRGLLIRDRVSFEKARNISAIVFDKTGTLTEGKFGITDVILLNDSLSKEEIIKIASSIESYSEHPIAKAISVSSKEKYTVTEFKAITGKGAQGKIEDKLIKIVSPGYLKENNLEFQNEEIEKLFQQGKTIVFVLKENSIIGAIALADKIRQESKEAIDELRKMNIKTIMLTGDNKKVAERVAKEIGLDEFFSEVLPQDKANKIKEVQQRGFTVAMTGDGVNDAPALAQADVGIAIGAGTDVAIETADIILIKSNPLDVVSLIKLSRATYRKMVQNLIWATGYNLFAIPLAAGVLYSFGILLSPALGAVLMSLSTVIVAINARLLKM
jgi:Cu2+-exporting ATPase